MTKLVRMYPYTEDEKKLLRQLPKKYHERFLDLSREDGLIDDCKFILYLHNGYSWYGYESLPVKSIREAVKFIKESDLYEVC